MQPLPASEPAGEADSWYVTWTNAEGRVVTKRLVREEVVALIFSRQFDPGTQASRTLNGVSRDLGTYPEFARYVRSRSARETADRKSSALRDLYSKIEEAERKRGRRGWLRRLTVGLNNWVTLLIVLALLTFITFIVVLLIRGFAGWLSGKTDVS